MKLNGIVYQSQFHVIQSLAHEVILGRDFLQEHGAVIDLKNSSLTLKDKPLELSKKSTSVGNDPVMATLVFPSPMKSTQERGSSCTDCKNSDRKISPVKEKYQKNTHHCSFRWSFWIFLLVAFYLLMTTQTHTRLHESHPAERKSKEKSCSATQYQAKTRERAFVTSIDHHSKGFTKTYAHLRLISKLLLWKRNDQALSLFRTPESIISASSVMAAVLAKRKIKYKITKS